MSIVTTHTHSHSHGEDHGHPHPHADLSQTTSDPIEQGALRTQRIAEFLEAHFGEVDIVDSRELEDGKLILDPAILVKLDEAEARVGLLDMVCLLVICHVAFKTHQLLSAGCT